MIHILILAQLKQEQPEVEDNYGDSFLLSCINSAERKLKSRTSGKFMDCADYNYINVEGQDDAIINQNRDTTLTNYRTDTECSFMFDALLEMTKLFINVGNDNNENSNESFNGYGVSYSSSRNGKIELTDDIIDALTQARLLTPISFNSENGNDCPNNAGVLDQQQENASVQWTNDNFQRSSTPDPKNFNKVLATDSNGTIQYVDVALPTDVYTKEEVDAKIDTVNETITTLDGQVVHNTGNENIAGTKVFNTTTGDETQFQANTTSGQDHIAFNRNALWMGDHKITQLGDPTSDQDATNKRYVDSAIANIPTPTPTPLSTIVGTFTPADGVDIYTSAVYQYGNVCYIDITLNTGTSHILGTISGISLPVGHIVNGFGWLNNTNTAEYSSLTTDGTLEIGMIPSSGTSFSIELTYIVNPTTTTNEGRVD